MFSGLSSLLELDLSNNFLENIPIAALANLKNLKFLNLGSNKIKVKMWSYEYEIQVMAATPIESHCCNQEL